MLRSAWFVDSRCVIDLNLSVRTTKHLICFILIIYYNIFLTLGLRSADHVLIMMEEKLNNQWCIQGYLIIRFNQLFITMRCFLCNQTIYRAEHFHFVMVMEVYSIHRPRYPHLFSPPIWLLITHTFGWVNRETTWRVRMSGWRGCPRSNIDWAIPPDYILLAE